jgi:prolyl 4-hydroxylase
MHYLIIEHFLSEQDCDKIIALGKSRQLERSPGFDLADGVNRESDYRTSFQTWLYRHDGDGLLADIERRIAVATGMPIENGEAFQLAYYPPGSYYKAHYDYFPEDQPGSHIALNRGGQRVLTFAIYLNTIPPAGGGETEFVNTGIKISPEKGKALVFWNVMPNWECDSSTYHQGLPPIAPYEKYLLNRWIRKNRHF